MFNSNALYAHTNGRELCVQESLDPALQYFLWHGFSHILLVLFFGYLFALALPITALTSPGGNSVILFILHDIVATSNVMVWVRVPSYRGRKGELY